MFYRINAVQLHIPPLRSRREDIPLLANHFLNKTAARINKRVTEFDEKALTLMERYDWPGNIRELENVIEAAVHLSDGETIGIDSLPDYLTSENRKWDGRSLRELVMETEKKAIELALKQHKFDKNKAAETLGIGNSTLYDKIKKYNLLEKQQ
ncbi:helix-turn-helix domain-containing protein [Bacillus marinisedimentorum]|uniref:helix-turn-helix domain-containing protein n=1 Tax=Bacillus marinisedimentorum TaxID=1821260 RepID=UPI000AD51FBE